MARLLAPCLPHAAGPFLLQLQGLERASSQGGESGGRVGTHFFFRVKIIARMRYFVGIRSVRGTPRYVAGPTAVFLGAQSFCE